MTTRHDASNPPADFWEAVFRHKKKILLTPLVIIAAAAAVILWAPRTYRSEAKLYLRVGRESVGLDPTATIGQTISLMQSGRDSEVNSALEVIASRAVISQVVDAISPEYVLRGGPEKAKSDNPAAAVVANVASIAGGAIKAIKSIDPVEPREEAAIELEKRLTINSERNSTVIAVLYEADTAEGAQAILDKLIEVYKREHVRINSNPDSATFFAKQRDLLEVRLGEVNERMRVAKNRMGLASIAGRRSTLEHQLQAVEQESYATEQALATASARAGDLTKQLDALPERMIASRTSIPNEGADALRAQLFALQRRQIDLKARYSDSHPLVIAISNQVDEAEKVVNKESTSREETVDDINPIHRQLSLDLKQQQTTIAGLEARLDTLSEQKNLIHQDLKQLNRDEKELDELAREVSLAESKFFKYSQDYEQARVDGELEKQRISSVSLLQPATLAEKPVSPSKLLVLLGAVALALGGTFSWVLACEQFNDRVRSREDVERWLSVPVLSEIPKSPIHGRVINY